MGTAAVSASCCPAAGQPCDHVLSHVAGQILEIVEAHPGLGPVSPGGVRRGSPYCEEVLVEVAARLTASGRLAHNEAVAETVSYYAHSADIIAAYDGIDGLRRQLVDRGLIAGPVAGTQLPPECLGPGTASPHVKERRLTAVPVPVLEAAADILADPARATSVLRRALLDAMDAAEAAQLRGFWAAVGEETRPVLRPAEAAVIAALTDWRASDEADAVLASALVQVWKSQRQGDHQPGYGYPHVSTLRRLVIDTVVDAAGLIRPTAAPAVVRARLGAYAAEAHRYLRLAALLAPETSPGSPGPASGPTPAEVPEVETARRLAELVARPPTPDAMSAPERAVGELLGAYRAGQGFPSELSGQAPHKALGKLRVDWKLTVKRPGGVDVVWVEVHGDQHFRPVSVFGGVEALAKCQRHDAAKATVLRGLEYDDGRNLFVVVHHELASSMTVEDLGGVIDVSLADPTVTMVYLRPVGTPDWAAGLPAEARTRHLPEGVEVLTA